MTIQQIRDHLATVVVAVMVAEDKVRPTLKERVANRKHTADERQRIMDEYVKDIVDEWLCSTSEDDLKKTISE